MALAPAAPAATPVAAARPVREPDEEVEAGRLERSRLEVVAGRVAGEGVDFVGVGRAVGVVRVPDGERDIDVEREGVLERLLALRTLPLPLLRAALEREEVPPPPRPPRWA